MQYCSTETKSKKRSRRKRNKSMKLVKSVLVFALVLLLSTGSEASRKHKNKSSDESKTKTKWSTSTYRGNNDPKTLVATEEHGYYVKRTFAPVNDTPTLRSPPYLAIPIAWFNADSDCAYVNSAGINGNTNTIQEGFLCDDDCTEPYEPICGKTSREVAVFYNKCKLNVAKCRTHGLWRELAYEECQQTYADEVKYTNQKFRSSPYFRIASASAKTEPPKEESILHVAMDALNDISDKIDQAETNAERSTEASTFEATTVSNKIENLTVLKSNK